MHFIKRSHIDKQRAARSAYHGEFTHGSLFVSGGVDNQEDAIVLTDKKKYTKVCEIDSAAGVLNAFGHIDLMRSSDN